MHQPWPTAGALSFQEIVMTRKLPWPASKVERDCLHQLWCEAKTTGVPITAIVKTAIDDYLNRRLEEARPLPASRPAGMSAQAA